MKDLKLISEDTREKFNNELNKVVEMGYTPCGELVVTPFEDWGVTWFKYSLIMKKE